jgi:hypothetical protein
VIVVGASVPLASVHDFFNSGLWTAISRLAILFLIVFWLAVAFWVHKDARRRVEDAVLVWTATALGLVLPFVGAIVYMLFRPPEYLDDVRERDLEIKAIEKRLGTAELNCPVCRAEIESSFLVCPVCTTRLKQACTGCGAPLEAAWQICPFCETAVESDGNSVPVPLEEPRRRRRRGA